MNTKKNTTKVNSTPALITPQEYLQDLKTRCSIHNQEFTTLVKDIYSWGKSAHTLLDQAWSEVQPTLQPVLNRVRN